MLGLFTINLICSSFLFYLQTSQTPKALEGFENMRCEFVPFLLNYLRDETSHLLQGCRSTNQSPTKTPSSVKRLNQKSESRSNGKQPRARNRLQLFSSPGKMVYFILNTSVCLLYDLIIEFSIKLCINLTNNIYVSTH